MKVMRGWEEFVYVLRANERDVWPNWVLGRGTSAAPTFKGQMTTTRKSGWQFNRRFLAQKMAPILTQKPAQSAIWKGYIVVHDYELPIFDILGRFLGHFYYCSSVPYSIGQKWPKNWLQSWPKIGPSLLNCHPAARTIQARHGDIPGSRAATPSARRGRRSSRLPSILLDFSFISPKPFFIHPTKQKLLNY